MSSRPRRLVAMVVVGLLVVGIPLAADLRSREERREGAGGVESPAQSQATPDAGSIPPDEQSSGVGSVVAPRSMVQGGATVDQFVLRDLDERGSATVFVTLDVTPTGDDAARAAHVADTLTRTLRSLPSGSYRNVAEGMTVGVVPMEIDREALDSLVESGTVTAVRATRRFTAVSETTTASSAIAPTSIDATTVEGAPAAWSAGMRGDGAAVAVIDTGVDKNHPFLTATAKTVWEACFVTIPPGAGWSSPCPGVTMDVDDAPVPGSAAPCPASIEECSHGTHVAGTAVGGTGTVGVPVSGVAPAADLVAVNVFSYNSGLRTVTSADTDVAKALQWIYNNRTTFPGLAAVNLSLGGVDRNTGSCDSDPLAVWVDQLADVGIATIAAAGNQGFDDGVVSPACISDVIAVGAINDADGDREPVGNVGPQLDVMAPGTFICSSRLTGAVGAPCPAPPGYGTMQYMTGTSMAAPAVSATVALLRAASVPSAEWRSRLQAVPVGGSCVSTEGYSVPALRVDVALGLVARATGPCAPILPAAEKSGAASVAVSWQAPMALGTGALVSYTATSSTGQSCTVSVPATTCTVTGLPSVGALTFTVAATSTTGTSGPSEPTDVLSFGMAVPVTPARIADTRSPGDGGQTVDGRFVNRGPLLGGTSWSIVVGGRGGVPTTGVGAVALNVTVTGPTASGFLTVFPTGVPKPNASSLNFVAGETVPNFVAAGLGEDGSITVFNSAGATAVIIDVVGWYPEGTGYTSLTPARILDTRAPGPGIGTVDGKFVNTGAVGAGATFSLPVTGRGGVPVDAGSVVLNVTAVTPTAPGFLTVFPTGVPKPNASNLNFVAGQVVPNAVVAEIGAGGKIDIFNLTGAVNVLVDVVGWMPAAGQFRAMSPARILDTRAPGPGISTVDGKFVNTGAIGSGSTLVLDVTGRVGVPASASAVMVNVTAVEPTAGGYLTVFPTGEPRPNASNLNFVPGQVVPNLVFAGIGDDGRISLFNFRGSTNVLVDIVGWFGPVS